MVYKIYYVLTNFLNKMVRDGFLASSLKKISAWAQAVHMLTSMGGGGPFHRVGRPSTNFCRTPKQI